ncbi:MAG TPA: SAM-dependent methyltransferase [Thermoanaerobaculia bacterium]|nr:SAM-dependent methyltransferase [Thermoanaerobaculia bacterium]
MSDIRNIGDTASWVAIYRAIESERPDALFRDPFARKLAGERGQQIYDSAAKRSSPDWAYAMRTYLVDRYIAQEAGRGVDMVINLAAGLDTRPYRMDLPASLQWVEVDLPEMIDAKEPVLAAHKPVCRLERVRLDLADATGRRRLFAQLGTRARKAMIVSEGLLIYLTRDQVGRLAGDLANVPSFQRWVTDLANPVILRMIQKAMGRRLEAAGAPLHFGPPEGPAFFEQHGWRVIDFESYLHNAARLKRVNFLLRFFAKISNPKKYVANRPWSAAVLLGR